MIRTTIALILMMASAQAADTYVLDPMASNIKYQVALKVPDAIKGLTKKFAGTKEDGKTVEGSLDQSQSILKGEVQVQNMDPTNPEIAGSVILEKPYFNTGIEIRDFDVAEMMSEMIEVDIQSPSMGEGQMNASDVYPYEVPVRLTWNGVSDQEMGRVQIRPIRASAEEPITAFEVSGSLDVDRQKYGVKPKGGHKFGDPFIENVVRIEYQFMFRAQ